MACNCLKPCCQSPWHHPLRRPVKVHCVILVLPVGAIFRDVSICPLVLLGWRWLLLWQNYWLQPGKDSKDQGGWWSHLDGKLFSSGITAWDREAGQPPFILIPTNLLLEHDTRQEMRQTREERQHKTIESQLYRMIIERTNYSHASVWYRNPDLHRLCAPIANNLFIWGFCKILQLPDLKCGMLKKFGPKHNLLVTRLLKSFSIYVEKSQLNDSFCVQWGGVPF